MKNLATKKITMATVKSFIKQDGLHSLESSSFDGMNDCVMPSGNYEFKPIKTTNDVGYWKLGIIGVYCVGSGRDYFTYYNDGTFEGIKISNCCGSSILAVRINK